MGSDKEEKKRLKAQAKIEKKKFKAQQAKTGTGKELEPEASKRNEKFISEPAEKQKQIAKVPLYKNPDWIRAIVGIASVIVAVLAIIISLYY